MLHPSHDVLSVKPGDCRDLVAFLATYLEKELLEVGVMESVFVICGSHAEKGKKLLFLVDDVRRADCSEKHPYECGCQIGQITTSVELVHGDRLEKLFKEKAVECVGLEGVNLFRGE